MDGEAMLSLARRLRRNIAGSVLPIGAITIVVVVGAASLAVDFGLFFYKYRRLQSMTDLAAVAAAEALSPGVSDDGNLAAATRAAAASLAANGYGPETLTAISLGRYEPDPSVPAAARFTQRAAGRANAVSVTTMDHAPVLFGAVLLPMAQDPAHDAHAVLRTRAKAANSRAASFGTGTRLLALDDGLLNSLLSALLGSQVRLSLMDYQALASANVDLFPFSQALATRLSLVGPSYDSLYSTRVDLSDVLYAAADAARAGGGSGATAASALVALGGATASGSRTVDLSRLVGFGPFSPAPVDGTPLVGAGVSLLQLVTAAAGIATGDTIVSVDLGASVPGIASLTLHLRIGERPAQGHWAWAGPCCAEVYTAQTRLLIVAQIAGSGLDVRLPIYLELASGHASARSVLCEPRRLAVDATPGLVSAWVADVSPADLANRRSIPHPPAATLVKATPLVRVTGRAHVAMANAAGQRLYFSEGEIGNGTIKSVSTRQFASGLAKSLVSDLQLGVNGASLLPPDTLATVGGLLEASAPAIDGVLTNVLAVAGVSLGQQDVWAGGVRCDGAVLVE